MAIFALPLVRALRVYSPNAAFLLPEVWLTKEFAHTAVLFVQETLSFIDHHPIAVFESPIVISRKALSPIDVFIKPVVFLLNV